MVKKLLVCSCHDRADRTLVCSSHDIEDAALVRAPPSVTLFHPAANLRQIARTASYAKIIGRNSRQLRNGPMR
jgi:hypothetical protein